MGKITKLNKNLTIMLLSQVLYSIVLTAAFGTINYTPILTKKKLSDKSYKNLVNIRESV